MQFTQLQDNLCTSLATAVLYSGPCSKGHPRHAEQQAMETKLQQGIKYTKGWWERKYLIWFFPLSLWVSRLYSPSYILLPQGKCKVLLLPLSDLDNRKESQKYDQERKTAKYSAIPVPLQLKRAKSRSLFWPQQHLSFIISSTQHVYEKTRKSVRHLVIQHM